MKIRYYGYHLQTTATAEPYAVDLGLLLRRYCQLNAPRFKNSFTHNGEKIFLLQQEDGLFIFIKTKDTETIKAINKRELSAHEISERLLEDESIGFASYIYLVDGALAFAATHQAPTIFAFSSWVNELLRRLDFTDAQIKIMPLAVSISRNEALRLPVIGKSHISVHQSSTIFRGFVEALGVPQQDSLDIERFEIIIKPIRGRNIRPAISHLLNLPPDDLEKFEIRAKAELFERMADYRIEQMSVCHDELRRQTREDIPTAIIRTVRGRGDLSDKVRQHAEENRVREDSHRGFIEFTTHRDWSRTISRSESGS